MNNKKMLSILISNILLLPSTASSSELEFYGSIAAAVETLNNGSNTKSEVSNNHSAIGIKGSTDLKDDIKGVFLFDTFIGIDSGNGDNEHVVDPDGADRESLIGHGRDGYVGLNGNFGTVALGYHGRPWKTSTNNMDIFNSTIADYSALMGSTPGGAYFDGGIGNGIIWFLPDINGFSGHLQYGADELDDNSNDTGLQLNYTKDNLYATFVYDIDGQKIGGDITASKIAGQYKLGSTTLGAIYDSISDSPNNSRNAIWLAASHNVGALTYKAAFAQAQNSDAGSDGATYLALGIDYTYVKNLTGYIIYSQISNEDQGTYGFVSSPHTSSNNNTSVLPGKDSSVISIGVKVDFSLKN